jgi:heme/copper-type cytochrome/quinol oxidase subunit 3
METEKNNLKSLTRVALMTGLILLVPYFAMLFNWQMPDPGSAQPGGVNWTLGDFVVMGVLLMSTGLVYEFGVKRVSRGTRRTAVIIALVFAFLLIWAELAVGLFGSPFAGN